MSDVHASMLPQVLTDHTGLWGTLGAHVVAANGARDARIGGSVSVSSHGT